MDSLDDLISPSTSSQAHKQEAFSWGGEDEPNPFADLQGSSVYTAPSARPADYDVPQISPFEPRDGNGYSEETRGDLGDNAASPSVQASERIVSPQSPSLTSPLSPEIQATAPQSNYSEAVTQPQPMLPSFSGSSLPNLSRTSSFTHPAEGTSTPSYDRVLVSPFRAPESEADSSRNETPTSAVERETSNTSDYFQQHTDRDVEAAPSFSTDNASIKTIGLESDRASSKTSILAPTFEARPESIRQADGGRPTFTVTVHDPQKVGSDMTASAHTLYTVRTRVSFLLWSCLRTIS
jgi:sorting nexin-1/2